MLEVKKMCKPSQIVLLVSLCSFFMQIFQTKGFFNNHNLLVIASMFLSQLTLAVMLDIFCKNGYKNFAWALVTVAFLVMVGADKLLHKGSHYLLGKHERPVKPNEVVVPYNREMMRNKPPRETYKSGNPKRY